MQDAGDLFTLLWSPVHAENLSIFCACMARSLGQPETMPRLSAEALQATFKYTFLEHTHGLQNAATWLTVRWL